jgi:glycosyltransferase involved in cell wall biosynthesis
MPLKRLGAHSRIFEVNVTTSKQFEVRTQMFGPLTGRTLLENKLWVISRLYRSKGLDDFVSAVKESGAVMIFDTDDDLTDDFRELGRGDEFKETIRRFDYVTVSTSFLADRMAKYLDRRPYVLPNHVDFEWFAKVSRTAMRLVEGFTIGLVGTASHHGDWIFPVEAMRKIAEEHEEVTLVIAGFFPEYLEDLPNVKKISPVPYRNYPGVIRQFDVVCCALDPDDVFNKSKSAIKALEAMAAYRPVSGKPGGAVPVCTDMKVYRRAVNHGHNGLLVDNEGWYDALKELVTNRPLARKLAHQGHRWVKQNRNIDSGWKRWESTYRGICKESGLY